MNILRRRLVSLVPVTATNYGRSVLSVVFHGQYVTRPSHSISRVRPTLVRAFSQSKKKEQAESTLNEEDYYYFHSKAVIIPHDDKIDRGGEDAAETSDRFLVVADGVGGWAAQNVDPGLYSKALTKHVKNLGERYFNATLPDVIHEANWHAADEHLGSATCTVLKLKGPNQIQAVNIGDSGYSIHRRNSNGTLELVFSSEPGQKKFNFPYQLGGQYGDKVHDVAKVQSHSLKPNDIIVVYSDGVCDNILPQQFHSCLDYASKDGVLESPSLAADAIARKAYFLGKDEAFDSPFSKGARAAGWGSSVTGGKEDDITCIVAQIRTKSSAAEYETDRHFKDDITLYNWPVAPLNAVASLESVGWQPLQW